MTTATPMPGAKNDTMLEEKLEELHRQHACGDDAPCDVIAAWEAVKLIAQQNKDLRQRRGGPYQMPEWLNDYLLRSANKIGRLSVRIRPEDDRPLDENFDGRGALCGVPEIETNSGGSKVERFRDKQADEVASALGLRTKGSNAFQRHDRMSRDDANLRILADPDVMKDKAARAQIFRIIAEKNHINFGGRPKPSLEGATPPRVAGRRRLIRGGSQSDDGYSPAPRLILRVHALAAHGDQNDGCRTAPHPEILHGRALAGTDRHGPTRPMTRWAAAICVRLRLALEP